MLPPRALPRQVLRVGAGGCLGRHLSPLTRELPWFSTSSLPGGSARLGPPIAAHHGQAIEGRPQRAQRLNPDLTMDPPDRSRYPTPPAGTATVSGLLGQGRAARDHVHEALEVAGGPALERRGAVALVGGHHGVAVVPVQARLRIEPKSAPGALADAPEDLGVGLAAVGAGIAEHDPRRARAEVVDDLLEELEPHPSVVGVAGDVGDAAFAADPVRDRAEVALSFEHLRDLRDPLDEYEAAELAE